MKKIGDMTYEEVCAEIHDAQVEVVIERKGDVRLRISRRKRGSRSPVPPATTRSQGIANASQQHGGAQA